jgi:WD40 repeat protein
VAIFDLLTGRLLVEFAAHQQATDAVSFSPDGQWLATGSQEGLAILWEVRTWKPAATFRGHLLGVHAVAFSPDGRRLVTGSVDREAVKWWDLASHQEILNLAWPGHLVAALRFSPDGRILAGLSSTSGMRLWRASDAPPAVAAPGGMPIPGRSVRR